MRIKISEFKQLVRDFVVEGKDTEPLVRDLAKKALSGDEESMIVLQDRLQELGKISFFSVLTGNDARMKKEILQFLADPDQEDFEYPSDWNDQITSRPGKNMINVLHGKPVAYDDQRYPELYRSDNNSEFLGLGFSMGAGTEYDRDVLLQMQWDDDPVPEFIVDYVFGLYDKRDIQTDRNVSELLYIIARSNVSKESAERLSTTPEGLKGLVDNSRYIRDYYKQYLATTTDPEDWNIVATCAMYADASVLDDIIELARDKNDPEIIQSMRNWGFEI